MTARKSVPQVEIREVPSRLGGDFVDPSPAAPIQIQNYSIVGVTRGYRGDDEEMREAFSGPTKRSADVNDYTALEAELARANEENVGLRAQLDASRKAARILTERLRRLDAMASIDPEEIKLYVEAREARATVITPQTPLPAIEAALEWQRRAKRVADLVVDAIARSVKAEAKKNAVDLVAASAPAIVSTAIAAAIATREERGSR